MFEHNLFVRFLPLAEAFVRHNFLQRVQGRLRLSHRDELLRALERILGL